MTEQNRKWSESPIHDQVKRAGLDNAGEASENNGVKNELINEIIDLWKRQRGLACGLGHLWMLDDTISELETKSMDQSSEILELKKDRDRLDWLLRDTIFLSGISTREKIDEAMEEDWFDRERTDKILSGM
jgi:HD superfamily phosphohydrolase